MSSSWIMKGMERTTLNDETLAPHIYRQLYTEDSNPEKLIPQ